MEWNVSNALMELWCRCNVLSSRWIDSFLAESPLDDTTWEELRKKLDFNEVAPEAVDPVNVEPSNFNFPMLMEALRFGGVVLIVLLLVFIVVRLIGGKKKRAGNDKSEGLEESSDQPTALTPMDVLWTAFKAAKAAGDLREALRILYQISIKKLSISGFVTAHPDKTNWEYVSEIGDPDRANAFAKITLVYETHWYGDEVLTDIIFSRQEPGFIQFIEALPDEK